MSNGAELKTKSSIAHEPHSIDDLTKDYHGRNQDVEKLKRSGVLIYVSSTSGTIELGARIRQIENSGKFGESIFVASLCMWEPEENVSLYIFRQPMDEMFSEINITQEKMEEMYEMTNQYPKTYFIMHFTTDEWTKHQSTLREYKLFRGENIINI
uniref:Uncharacterized protein LOC111115108 n=1 Tax=Crassostrea virginica TaxID=6565 RepID=A0A8B8C357_CRAVI|nr:uncharacterized protein LOC111115108 [Crassostrea virginica]